MRAVLRSMEPSSASTASLIVSMEESAGTRMEHCMGRRPLVKLSTTEMALA